MDKRNLRILHFYVGLIIIINVFLVSTQINWSEWGYKPNLDFSKDFANAIVMTMQDLAKDLGVSERSNVKQALAKLHYDVYLAGSRADLAAVVQNNASDTRNLIVTEYVKSSGEQVLMVLNNAPEVQTTNTKVTINVVPMPDGGYSVLEANVLRDETLAQLENVSTLFNFETFRNNYENYRRLSTLQIEIEQGRAQLATPNNDQDTLKYWEREIQNIRNDYTRISKTAGFAEISGPGVSVTIHNKLFSVQAGDLRRIVGEFYSAGATAISISGHRLAVNSYIIDGDEGISIDGFMIGTNPVVIEVLGDQQTLLTGIDLLFNVVMKDMFYVNMESHDNLVLPGKVIQ